MTAFFILSTLMASQTVEAPDSLADIYGNLDELVVEAKKETIKSNGETLTYDLSQDDSAKAMTLLEALKKVPMVTVDGEDKIRINGDSNFRIYVNGKEDPMLEANYDKIFKAMPANSVQKIEVITEPGAKFDAEGSAGILNIITETKQKKDGYSGSIVASISNRDYFFSLMGRMKYRNFSADANVTYGANLFSPDSNTQSFRTVDDASDSNHLQILSMKQKFNYNFVNASLNTSWEPNESNLFTLGGSVMSLDADIVDISSNTSMFDRQGRLQWSYNQDISGGLKNFAVTANASYQHFFNSQSHFIVASWLFNFGRNPLDLLSRNSYDEDVTPISYTLNNSLNFSREHTFQLDYTNPFGSDHHKLETGAKAILRHNSAYGHSTQGLAPDNLVTVSNDEVNMTQIQDIYALYASYTGSFGKLTAKAGIRYEHTRMEISDKNRAGLDFSRRLNDVVPNAALTWLFSLASNLRLAYQMKISRPSIQQMNPFQMDIFGSMVQEGNPDLESEHTNKISLTYTNYSAIMGGNVYIDYKYTDNAIVDYSFLTTGDDGSIIYHSTTANIGSTKEIGLGGFYNLNISRNMSASVNGRIAYVSMMSPSPLYKNHGWTGNYGANWNYTGPLDIRFSAYGGQSCNTIRLQGNYSGWYYYGVGISRNFIKDSLTVALSASNFLQSSICFKSTTYVNSQTVITENRRKSWKVALNLTWNFGHLNSSAKKTSNSIDNDDLSTSGNKGGGGMGI